MAYKRNDNNRAEQVKAAAELLERGVNEVFESGRFAEWLDVMGRFHHYSARNCVLIMMQCPNATHVASYKKWQKDFNRQVRKGEKSIRILAPIQHRRTVTEVDEATGKETETEHCWTSFKAVPVFDISQTDGDELPTIAERVDGSVDDFDDLCGRIAKAATVRVELGADIADPDCNGYYSRTEDCIRVRGGMSEAQTVKTLVHEVAHSILHCEGGSEEDAPRQLREVQSEGVAYVVCNALGIDTSDYSFGYVASWGGDTKALVKALDAIRSTANAILDKVA